MLQYIMFSISYIISILLYRRWVKIAYSRGGALYGFNLKNIELFLTLCPFINTLCCIMWIVCPPSRDIKEKREQFLHKFFNIT